MRTLAIGLIVATLCTIAMAESRGPSTPQERKRALQVIEKLEQDPMSPALKEDRDWVFQWVKEVPDIHAQACMAIVGPLMDEKLSPARNALTLQNILASAAFVMQYPEKANDPFAVYLAGTQGMLRAYGNIVKVDPSKKDAFLESLLKKQQDGTLEDFVRKGTEECRLHPATTLKP